MTTTICRLLAWQQVVPLKKGCDLMTDQPLNNFGPKRQVGEQSVIFRIDSLIHFSSALV